MKKFLAIALAALMIAALAVPAFAAEMNWEEVDGTERTATDVHYGENNDVPGADNYLVDAEDSQGQQTIVKYGVAQAYIVTIPAEIRLHQATEANKVGDQTVGGVYGYEMLGVSDVVIAKGEEICIYVSSLNYADDTWQLVDTEDGTDDDTHTSDNVYYTMVAKDVVSTDEDNLWGDEDTATKYLAIKNEEGILSLDNANSYALVVSGTGVDENDADVTTRDASTGCVLKQSVATGNIGTTGSGKTVELYFSSLGTAQEGTYKDTLTFTVRIQDVVNP